MDLLNSKALLLMIHVTCTSEAIQIFVLSERDLSAQMKTKYTHIYWVLHIYIFTYISILFFSFLPLRIKYATLLRYFYKNFLIKMFGSRFGGMGTICFDIINSALLRCNAGWYCTCLEFNSQNFANLYQCS